MSTFGTAVAGDFRAQTSSTHFTFRQELPQLVCARRDASSSPQPRPHPNYLTLRFLANDPENNTTAYASIITSDRRKLLGGPESYYTARSNRRINNLLSTSFPENTWSSCDKLNEHIKRSHSRRPYCPKCKVSFRKDASEKELQEQKQRHEEQKQRDEATCVETNWPDDNRILSESQDEGFRGFKKTKAKIYRGCIRSDILLQNWRNMNLSLGFPEVDASIMEGWRVGPGSGSVATVPHHALRPTRNTPKPAHDTSELEAVQLGQSGGYPQTIGPPGDIAMDIGSNTVMLDIFTDTLDPALTSGYSGDISPEQRRQDALTCTPLAPRGPIVPTSDASTLVAETESSDTTLHDEELGQPLQDYESGKKWVMEASEGAERIQRAFVMFDKHSELSGKHSGLSDSFFTLAGNLTAAHDGAKSQHSQDGSWGSAPEGNRTPPPTLEGLSPNH